MNIFQSIFKHLLDALFPKRCVGCQKIGHFLCGQCVASLPPSLPIKQSFISGLFDYRHPVIKRAIWQFKYKNIRGMAEPFGEKLYEEIIGDLGEQLSVSKDEIFFLVPIPLHAKRLRERGYNQSELIARSLLKHDVNNIFRLSTKLLVRIRATRPQAKKEGRAARLQNLRGAFEAPDDSVRGKHIILIDDVVTTGATLSEARKVLQSAGARSVHAYTVAH